MRSRLLYVVPFLLTAVPASAQYYGGPGPGYPYAGPEPIYSDPSVMSQTTVYPMYQPIEQVVVRRRVIMPPAPVVVQPAPVIVNNNQQVVVREKIVYVTRPRVKHRAKPPCNCAN